jgi:hypothetical protein
MKPEILERDKVPIEDIIKMVDYLYDDEQHHYEECKLSGDGRGHIFLSVRRVAKWLGSD